ncbi:MAG: ferredoxin--NADP reductase [Thermoplasmatota archaeon]
MPDLQRRAETHDESPTRDLRATRLTARVAAGLAELLRPAVESAVQSALRGLPAATGNGTETGARTVARVSAVSRPTKSLALLRLRLTPEQPYKFVAGQFCMIYGESGPPRRPYSIASPPFEPLVLDFAVADVNENGDSGWLYHRQPGDTIELGPARGVFTFKTPPGQTAVFLATGTGAAPFRSMLWDQWGRGEEPEIWFFLGARVPEEIPYRDEFQSMALDHPSFHYIPVVSRAAPGTWAGEQGHIQGPFFKAFGRRTDFDAYLCGVPAMVAELANALRLQGVPADRIHQERYL